MKMTMQELKDLIKEVIAEFNTEAVDTEVDDTPAETEESSDEPTEEAPEETTEEAPEEAPEAELEGETLPISDESEEVEESVEPEKQILNEDVASEFYYYVDGKEVTVDVFNSKLRDAVADEFGEDRVELEYLEAIDYMEHEARRNLPEDVYPQTYGNTSFQIFPR